MMRTNKDRAASALDAVECHNFDGNDIETAMSDLLADMMHLAQAEKLSWFGLMDRAHFHYDAEVREDI